MRVLIYVAALTLSVALTSACSERPAAFHSLDIGTVAWGGDHRLQAHDGRSLSLSDFRGKVVAVFFGFTHCPDICSPTLMRLAAISRKLGAQARDLQVLFVTVDPQRDTAAQLAGFVPRFHPDFLGLTGAAAKIERMLEDYKVAVARPAGGGEAARLEHSGGIFLRDRHGRLRLYAKEDVTQDQLLEDIRRLLAESA